VPDSGFIARGTGYVAPNGETDPIEVDPESSRLQLLEPFARRAPEQFADMAVLLKAVGQCTTDHISPAGPWLRFRGHLDNISDNMFLGANNAFADQPGHGPDLAGDGRPKPLPEVARNLAAAGRSWVAVGDENYGEGSSREHAAMSPRLLGAAVVITRSFARIHETNLKKQGVLPLTFDDRADYDLLRSDDRITLEDVAEIAPGRGLRARIDHSDGSVDRISLSHTLNPEQIAWLWAGSALNVIRSQTG
ncbi:MAG: aconitate hydratase, partial [Chloroflexota bacterium]|nr:aconitate hydratase [Chloroflexota bacterium]